MADNFWTSIAKILDDPVTSTLGHQILNAIGAGMRQQAQASHTASLLLHQLQATPEDATKIAATIATLPGLPTPVQPLVAQLPAVANANNPMALLALIVQIESLLAILNSPDTWGSTLHAIGARGLVHGRDPI